MFQKAILISIAILLSATGWALPPDAVLLNKAGSSRILVEYFNVYYAKKTRAVQANGKFVVSFDENAYQPTLLQFCTRIPEKGSALLSPGQTALEQPVLVVLPGDSITVDYDAEHNIFEFTGRHQTELNFYKKIWLNQLSLSYLYFETIVADTRMPLDQYLQKWHNLKQEGESIIAEIEHTSGVRPKVAAFLARNLRLRLLTLLTLPAVYQRPQDSLRVFTPRYQDSVTIAARILNELRDDPATSTDGLVRAWSAYTAYRCVLLGRYPTFNAKYALAKQELTGFQRAWVCFHILAVDGVLKHKNISWRLQDYQRWAHPYDEFVRVLKGDPTVPFRSYKGTVFADSLAGFAGSRQPLADVLAQHKGQVVLLDLWASWCGPCLEELPATITIDHRYRNKGLVVMFLSIDKDGIKWREAVRRLPKSSPSQFRFVNPGASAFLKELEVASIPRYVLIDRSGKVHNPDALHPIDPRFEAVLRKLLAAQ